MTLRSELKRLDAERKALEPERLAEMERQGTRIMKDLGVWNRPGSYVIDDGRHVTPGAIMLAWEDAVRLAALIRSLKRQAARGKR